MECAMLVKMSSQIYPNSTKFGVNMELSAKDTRRENNLGKNNLIYSSPRSAILRNKYTLQETVYLCLKLVVDEAILKNMFETF